MPDEPVQLRDDVRARLEDSPEEGARLVGEANFVADLLWEGWSETLDASGMDHDRFVQIARGYSGELRLWVVGERPWDQCVSGLAGRVKRRLPAKKTIQAEV